MLKPIPQDDEEELTCCICGNPHPERRKTCSKSCAKTLQIRNTPGAAYNDFLPPDAEENLHGFWVPSPEEIEAEKRRIRKMNDELALELRHAR